MENRNNFTIQLLLITFAVIKIFEIKNNLDFKSLFIRKK